ncbi:MAG: MMPL family transporter, partial [Myxococcota bacterium]
APTAVALREGITKAGPGMLVGATTTMMAFLMTGVIEFTAYSELGVITASGLALMVAVTFLLLPPLIFLAGKGKTISSPELKGMARVPDLIRKGAVPLLASGVVLIGLGASTFGGLRFNARYFDFLPETTESAKALFAIEDDEQVTPVQSSSSTESLEEARRLADDLRALDSVGAVHTPSDLVPALTPKRLEALRAGFADTRAPNFDKLRDGSRTVAGLGTALTDLIDIVDEVAGGMRSTKRDTAAIDQVKTAARSLQKRIDELGDSGPTRLKDAETRLAGFLEPAWRTAQRVAAQGKVQASDLPGVFQARFVARDGKGLAVYATPRGDIWKEENAKRFAREVQSVDAEASGLAVTIHEHMRMIKDGFRKASLFTIAGVILILLISFRRLDDALVAMTPVVIGISIMLGFMGSRGIPFDVANVVSLPLIVGVGIDAGAHMVHRWRLSAVENGGVGSLDELMRGTGAAVLMASLTTAIGFAALVFADYGGMRSLGVTMTVGVLGCLFSAVLVLPAGLVVWGKVR